MQVLRNVKALKYSGWRRIGGGQQGQYASCVYGSEVKVEGKYSTCIPS